MKSYLKICKDVIENGKWKGNRTGIKTLMKPNMFFSHDMENGFPLLTTKKIAWKSMLVELEGFIKGITSKRWFEERNCKFWSYWCNPKVLNRKIEDYTNQYGKPPDNDQIKEWQTNEQDLGPLGYSHGWRRFGQIYDEDHNGCIDGYDQFDYVVKTLKNNPDDRRMVVSAWNPLDLDRVALPSCHYTWCVTHCQGTLNLHWSQR